MALFNYPKNATFGRILPKSKIYEHSKPSTKLKELFTQQIDKITWAYKLAPETINLPATPSVPEIEIFHIKLKTGELSEDVLRCIDKAIPYPLIFELKYNNKLMTMAAFKRPSEADTTKWVISDYFKTDWLEGNTSRTTLPVVLNLSGLYENLISPLIPYKKRKEEDIQACLARMELIHAKQRELDKIKTKLNKEKQFNHKVAINSELRKVEQEIKQLIHA